jgi:hypothetical protein
MAQVAAVALRSRGGHGDDARMRFQADNDRLAQEVALLAEELWIKDARMERVPTPRRPHYPPVERLAILELRPARG